MMRALPAAALLSAFGILSRILGVLRDRLLTSTFGAGEATDAFLAANRVPDLLYQLLIVGAISSVFLPTYTRTRHRSDAEARQLAGNVLAGGAGVLAAAAGIAMLFAGPLAQLLGAGFSPATLAETTTLMRWMLLAPVLLGASSILAALLQAHGTFWSFALAPVLYNVGQIAGITLLGAGWGIEGAAAGVVVGAALHAGLQLLPLAGKNLLARPKGIGSDPALRTMLRQAVPRMVALGAGQIQVLIETALASLLAAGSITALSYAHNLMSFPLGVIGIPVAVAAFPLLAEHHTRSDGRGFAATLSRAIRQTLFWTLPAAAGLLLVGEDVVRVLFGSDGFTNADVRATSAALAGFSVALVAQALLPTLAKAFYAMHETRTPVRASLVAITLNTVLALVAVLALRLGVWSLAVAFACASAVNLALHLAGLRSRIGRGGFGGMAAPVLRIAVATAGMALVVWSVLAVLASPGSSPWAASLIRLAAASAIGGISYLAFTALIAPREFREATRRSARTVAPEQLEGTVLEHEH